MASTSTSRSLTAQLRLLLALLQKHQPQSFSYREAVQLGPTGAASALQQPVLQVFKEVGVVGDVEYSILLLRKLILARFELLCACTELIHDVKYSYREIKDTLLALEAFNHHTSSKTSHKSGTTFHRCARKPGHRIELADLVDIFISTHTKWLCTTIMCSDAPSGKILHLAQFESNFVRAFLGLLGTFTSLLSGKRREYVSSEMFGMCSDHDNIGWSDCLIPGAQSEILRRLYHSVSLRLWSKVAEGLVHTRSQPVILKQEDPICITEILKTTGLESFPLVVNCLTHVSTASQQQQCLIKWDIAFQKLLAATLTEYRKSHRRPRSNAVCLVGLCQDTLDCLEQHLSEQARTVSHVTSDSPTSILTHLSILTHSLLATHATNISLEHVTFSLLQGLGTGLCTWNLSSLAWILFNDLPALRDASKRSVAISYCAASPRVSFPTYSSLHTLECFCRDVCSSLHSISRYLQETVEDSYKYFQTEWMSKCEKVVKSSFPRVKYWKNIRIKEGPHQIRQSRYCDVVIQHLFLPLAEAAVKLPLEQQESFVYLTTVVFYQQYRKLITANKKLYSVHAGRQLLTDFRYLQSWLMSSDQQLGKPSLRLLSTAPTLVEVERGLLSICNCGMVESGEKGSENKFGKRLDITLPSNNFPVLLEIPWNSPQDWWNCILV